MTTMHSKRSLLMDQCELETDIQLPVCCLHVHCISVIISILHMYMYMCTLNF